MNQQSRRFGIQMFDVDECVFFFGQSFAQSLYTIKMNQGHNAGDEHGVKYDLKSIVNYHNIIIELLWCARNFMIKTELFYSIVMW